MPHNRRDWEDRIKAAEREYHAVRVAVDWLLVATPDEIHDVTEERGWDDLAVADTYAADRHLDATYLFRMFSVFERAVFSYWRLLPGNEVRDAEGEMRLAEVGAACVILEDVIKGAQAVRVHRNNLVHGRIDEHYASMTFDEARSKVLTYLGKLPEQWG
jgi:hypothetical protein